jgi:hypothetical protein
MYDIIAVDRTTYRINKNTGKISLIYQNGKIIDVEPPLKQELRELWDAEENYLTGRGGLNQYDKNSFKATVYNGNSYVVVNTITFSVDFKHTKTGKIEIRKYKVSVHIPPLSTQDVSFSILSSGPDYEFTGWGIDSAEGVDAPLPNLQTNK